MQKLRELKFKYAENGTEREAGGQSSSLASPDEAKSHEAGMASSLIQENQSLKKEIEFMSSEVERLRSKLIVDDEEMPPLSFDVQKCKDDSETNSCEIRSLKESLQTNLSNSRNDKNLHHNTAINFTTGEKGVPKLDFKRLK